jgi:RNA polymerase sigma-70 factor (ECF subfamily)
MSQPAERKAASKEIASAASEQWSDEEIVGRVLAGEIALFELVMRRYNRRVFRVVRSIIGEDSEAEDIVQEAYVRAFQNLRQFEGRSLFSTWLTKIAVYEATARRRKQRRWSLVGDDTDLDSMAKQNQSRDAAEQASQAELGTVLARAVDALPAELRVVFTMRMVEGLDTEETAECLELSAANVKTRLHRARAQLQTWVDRQIGVESRDLYLFDGERCDRIVAKVMSRIAGERQQAE